ncbi:translation initiation factor eIF-2B subunit alpha [Savitreella phatthalungensis]
MTMKRPGRLSRVATSIDSPAGSFDVLEIYHEILKNDAEITMPLAAIYALLEVLRRTNSSTAQEYTDVVKLGKKILTEAEPNSYSLRAGCDIFQRFVLRSLGSSDDFAEIKRHLFDNGQLFLERAREARSKIAELGAHFIKDDSTILVHSYSRVVLAVLTRAARHNKRFRVYITESRPNGAGLKTKRVLESHGVPTCMLLDVAVGYAMEKADLVLVGAEGVVENGGLINQVGTLNVASLAKLANVPFYAVAESHKFVRIYPLNQYDLPTRGPVLAFSDPPSASSAASPRIPADDNTGPVDPSTHKLTSSSADVRNDHVMDIPQIHNNPQLDLTPPQLITGLITDLGVLNPMSGVSEELIRLWY